MPSSTSTAPIQAVGHPGGVAPQFVVQYYQRHEELWVCYRCFELGRQADECRSALELAGYEVRIISHRIYPTAA